MKPLAFFFLLFLSSTTVAQEKIQFMDEQGRWLPDDEGAYFYRVNDKKGDLYRTRIYYVSNDKLNQESNFSDSTRALREGKFTKFYENGTMKVEGVYSNDEKSGIWREFYENGQQAEEVAYRQETKMLCQHWDEAGNTKLIDGTGTYRRVYNGEEWNGQVVDSLFTIVYYIEKHSGDSIYTLTDESATYHGGMDAFYQEVGNNLKYPKLARQFHIEGKVFIQFIIDKKGMLRDAEVLSGIGGGCDQAALDAVIKNKHWVPGKLKSRRINQRMILPIAFRIEPTTKG